jgi:hypothetical protein
MFAAKIYTSRTELVWLVTGTDKGQACWHFLYVDKIKLEIFKARLKTGSLELKDYGTILYSGWGTEPPEDIKQKIQEQFG